MRTKLTVGIPVYNAMPHLRETMESLFAQSYGDFAMVAINDGSTDGSADYLQAINDPRLTIVHQRNCGLTATLNRMLDIVQTPWLVRQDADDVSFPTRIERIAEYVARFPDAGMFYSKAAHYQDRHVLGELRTTESSPDVLRAITRKGFLLAICHPAVVLNVAKTRALGAYRFDLHVEEYDLYWRMALHHDIQFIPECLVGHRLNCNSICGRNVQVQSINMLYIQYLLLSQLWDRQPLSSTDVADELAAMVDRRYLRFRQHMRAAVSDVGARRYAAAAKQTMLGFQAFPSAFIKRCLYNRPGTKLVRLGESPDLFLRRQQRLWPIPRPHDCSSPLLAS